MIYFLIFCLITLSATGLGLFIRALCEPRRPEVTYTILGEGGKSLKLILLTDLHAGYLLFSPALISQVILKEKPDILVFGGDLSNNQKDFDKGIKILRELKQTCDEIGIPFLAVRGNHDPEELCKILAGENIVCLKNENFYFENKDSTIWHIIGLDDFRTGESSYKKALIQTEKQETAGKKPQTAQLVLAHNPDSFYEIRNSSKHLTSQIFLLSGHFHGGQVWLPFNLEYTILRQERMSKEGYRKGAYEKDGIKGYISRGLGCVIIPLRLFSRPEIAVLTIKTD